MLKNIMVSGRTINKEVHYRMPITYNLITGKPEYLIADSHGKEQLNTIKISHADLKEKLKNGFTNDPLGRPSKRYVSGSVSRYVPKNSKPYVPFKGVVDKLKIK